MGIIRLKRFNKRVEEKSINSWIVVLGFITGAIGLAFGAKNYLPELSYSAFGVLLFASTYIFVLVIVSLIGTVPWIAVFFVTVGIVEPILERKGMTEVVPKMDFSQFIGVTVNALISVILILSMNFYLFWLGILNLLGGGLWGFIAEALKAAGDAEAQMYGYG